MSYLEPNLIPQVLDQLLLCSLQVFFPAPFLLLKPDPPQPRSLPCDGRFPGTVLLPDFGLDICPTPATLRFMVLRLLRASPPPPDENICS